MADLRTRAYATLTPAAQARKDSADQAFVEDQALQAAASSELRRGWEAAGLSEKANALMTGAAKAYDSGDVEGGKALENEGLRTLQTARAWAPSVQNFSDIDGLGSAARWAGGALGNIRSSIKPALGGLAGAAVGGLLTRSAKGAQTGAMIGSGLTGYDQMADEAIGGAMVDPEIRANKSYSDIINAGRVSGAIQAPLEGLVPAMTVGAVAGLGKRALKGGIAAAAGREITREGAGEFGTEFAQDLVGQGTQNYLKDRGVADDLDYQRALNAGAAGAVAGGAMGGIGGAGHAVHGTLGSAADAVTDVTSDPKNTINKISAAAGETLAKGFNHLDDYINKVSVDRDLSALMGGVRPHEVDLDGAAFADARRVHADAYAGRVLSQPNLYDPELVKAASDYGQHRDPFVFQGALRGHFDAKKQADVDTGIADELNGTTKQSKMRGRLTDDFGEREGRDPTDDVVIDDFGMLVKQGQPELYGGVKASEASSRMTDRQGLIRKLLNEEGRAKAEVVKDEEWMNIGLLAELWRKRGINEGVIQEVSDNVAPAQREAAIAIMSWVARGFKGADGEVLIPEKMIQAYGKDAQKLVENAYTLAVQQGVVDHEATKDTFTGIKKRVGELAKRYEADADMIFDNMTPVARSKFEQTLESDSRGEFLAKLGPVAKDLRALANGGEIAKNHEAALDSWFGPRKNTVLDNFYEEKNADAGLNEASVKAANSDDTDDRHIERSGLSDDAVMGDSDWNSPSRLGTDNSSVETTSSHKYEPRSKANEYFDMRDASHADQWSQRSKEKLAVAEGDATQRSVQQIGMVDRELEKAAEAKGGELTADEIKAVHEKLVLEHDKIAAPSALPDSAGPGQQAAHKAAVADYERRVRGSVARLNRRFKAMRVKSEELAKPGVNFSKQDVADIHQSSRDLRGPNATIQHGVLLFDNGNAKPYVTSAAAILRLVHRVKDGSSESFTEYGGDAHSLHEKLMAGISSMLDADPKFTGRIGYIKYAGSQPTWLKSLDQLPDDFVFGRKEGRPLTVREALMQRDLSRAKLDAKAKEPNVSDKPYTGTDYRDVKQSTKAKAFSLGKLSTNFNAKLTKDERRGIMEATHEFWEVVKGNDTDAIAEASKAVDELFDKYKPKHVKELSESWSPDDDKTPSENTALASQDQGDMLLREDDPSKIGEDNPIHRDEHGFLKTDNATMKAANMGSSGSAVKVEPGVATKTKKAVERGTLSTKTVIEWLRSSVGKVMSNLREQIENGHLDSAKDAVDRLENLSEMTVARVMALAPDMSEINAERLISRAKNALQRARAIVDAEGGVSDERVTENGASKEVGQGRSGNLRKVGHAPAAERTGHSANTGPVAGEVQRHGREGVAEGADAKTRLSMEDVKTLLNDMVATRNADTSLLRKILRDGDISHELRTELTNDLAYLESIKAGSMEGSVAQKTVDGWSKMFAGGAKIIISRVKGQPSSVKTNMNAFQVVIDGKRYLVTTGGSSKETSLSTLAHEFGHALQFTIFDNASADVRSAVKSAWEKDVAAATADPRSTSRFMSGARLSGAIDNETVESIPDGMFPLRKLMGSVGESVFNSEHKEYVLSFEEWFAEQFSRYVTSDVDVNLAQDVKGFWRGLIATFKKFFDVVIKPLQPNNTFKGWVDGLRDAKQEHEGADAVASWVSKAVKADQKKLTAVIEKMTPEQINKALDVLDSKQFIKNPELDASEAAAFGRLFDTLAEHLPENKDSKQKAEGVASKDEAVEAAKKHILDTVGPNIELSFAKAFRDGGSGSWSKGAVKNAIRLALNGDVLGTAYHESMHEFFDILGKHGGENTQTMLKRVAGNKIILRKLSRLLEGHAEAQAQLSDPEEALAYMYQFWKAGTLSLAPETQSWFQKIEGYVRGALGMLSEEMKAMKDMAMVDDIFKAFDNGVFADESHRSMMVEIINRDVEKREAIEKAVGEKWNTIVGKAGKYVLSAESVIEAADNKYMTEELRQYNQKTGEAMGGRASYFEAVATKRNQYMNRLETLFKGVDKEDLEVARKALSTKTTPTDPVALKIVEGIRAIQEELFEYSAKKNVARLDDEKHEWVGIEHRKDYYPQVWDVDTLMKNGAAFKTKLLEVHMLELKAIAKKANAEIKNGSYVGENTASNEQLKKQTSDRQEVTPELVADAILARVLNSGGYVEPDESISALGMSPVATSVNRRQLSWIDAKAFDEFKSKDIVNTMTSYVSSMVKRAEHTERFGHGGELTRERADKAVVYEIGGDKLVGDAEKMLPGEIAKWRKAKAKALSAGAEFDEPYPTIRSVGEYLYGVREGEAVLKAARAKAVKKLEQSFKAVMALEGTLGADISQNMRAMNSWMMTYQNFRLLSTTLFSSFADVVGLVVNGGELGDAWDGFVSGIREVKLRWGNDKSQDKRALRAETWGTVDAGSFMDALGQTYGSSFLTGTARRMSDQLFKWNGMEGWNRAMRITATSVAERIIRDYKTEGFDHSDKAAVARFEELFGKGFKPEDIKLDADGELDQTDTKNQAAVSKWVNGAILRPNAAQRTIWGSDPHYQMLWHMKQFTYTFQAVILAKVVEQAKLGNYRPAMVMMAGYTPVIIAADAIKEMLIPGDEPPWMKGGLGKFIQHGVDKAGMLGVGQMGYDAFAKDYGAGLTGPAISQLLHVPLDPVAQTTLGALPMGNLARRIAQ